ncbi:uncharacterized protein C8A04DRAFT_11003 [Dichotomopilus funicola]|uniref:Uncharacterized protein n=1 Tax=Dichotomopilus funicola TaxID=1934379 RepID=A0AAN6V5D2_9PEZI|nr:hypothetical protein C8A04DRAFT_11003 [Dichotomopilus funicola]
MSSAQGKTVIVTGAAGGLGKAIAAAFLFAGANVVICDVNQERLTSVESEWSQSHAGKFLTQQTDVTDDAAVQKLVDDTVAKFGRLDVLVNNAGIMDDFSPVGTCSREQWDRVLGINLNGPYLASKAAIAQFEKQKGEGEFGVIINIGSTSSVQGFKAGAAYSVSKAGLVALTKNTAGFYGDKGIHTIALLLGGMDTNITDAFARGLNMEAFEKIQASQTPFSPERRVPIESVAKYCVFLSDKDIAPSANGSCVPFNKNWPEA